MSAALRGIPAYMHATIAAWVDYGTPHPSVLGSFFKAILSDSLTRSIAMADTENRAALLFWGMWLYNDCPRAARGDAAELLAWHEHGGLVGIAVEVRRTQAAIAKLDELDPEDSPIGGDT